MRAPPSQHISFFSSLKQLEKRLKTEHPSQLQNSKKDIKNDYQNIIISNNNNVIKDSITTTTLSSPLYINTDQTNFNTNTTDNDDSEPPTAFLTCSSSSTQKNQYPSQENITEPKYHDFPAVDDIQRLIQLLGVSGCEGSGQSLGFEGEVLDFEEDEFYERVVEVNGPKCRKEVERLKSWIEFYYSNGEILEPLRLAHLLLGKAAFVFEVGDDEGEECGFGGLEFPKTVEEFLKNGSPGDTHGRG